MQGSNPISDIWARHSLDVIRKFFTRSVYDCEDREARWRIPPPPAQEPDAPGLHLCWDWLW